MRRLPTPARPGLTRSASTAVDLAAIAVALWALLSDDFAGMLPGNLLPILASLVILSSLWRLWHRWRR